MRESQESKSPDRARTIILCAGRVDHRALPVSTDSAAMIPVNGKPVISWILQDLAAGGIRHCVVVINDQSPRLQQYLKAAGRTLLSIETVSVSAEGTILDSLKAGLVVCQPTGTVRVVLGDTLIRDEFGADEDMVYAGSVDESRRWCVVDVDQDEIILSFTDKNERLGATDHALAGYYQFADASLLVRCVDSSRADGARELSEVLRRYNCIRPIKAKRVTEWYDFGHIDRLVDARQRLLRPRSFNFLTIDPLLSTITKTSQNDGKLRDELRWYKELPERLAVLTPRVVSTEEDASGNIRITQEYYGYPTLAEMYVFGEFHADTWKSILRRVLQIHQEFRKNSGQLPAGCLRAVYMEKTWSRLEALARNDPFWSSLMGSETVYCDGRALSGPGGLRERMETAVGRLESSAEISVIHGDLCFSNILFDLSNQIVRLIDPRGSFGIPGIYGDPRYDIAKLRHSVCGFYDYILADLFEIEGVGSEYHGRILAADESLAMAAEFDGMIESLGYKSREIKLIEGLLFISMVPLHTENRQRQLMMYFRGLTLLNETLLCE